jgi:hypothetical protein
MADTNVHITGAESGAFTEAFNGLPPWATDDTAVKIQGILNKMYGLHASTLNTLVKKIGASGGVDPKDMKNWNDEIEKANKYLKKENDEIPKKQKERKEVEDHHKKQVPAWKNVITNLTGFNFGLLTLEGIAIAIGIVLKENFNTFTKLNESGINMIAGFDGVTNGFQGVQQLAVLTGVRFTDLAETMTKYSTAVNQFSAGKFAKAVGTSSLELGKFGFTAKEAAELTGAMLEAQRGYTDISLKTDQQASDEVVKLGKNIFRLTMATGMARSQILANMDALAQSTDANVLAGQVGEQGATDMASFLASFKDQNVARQLLSLFSAPIKPLNQTFMNLQKTGMGGFATALTSFQKQTAALSPEMRKQAMKSFIAAHRGELEANKQRLAMLAQAGVEGAQASLDLITGLTQAADATVVQSKKEIEAQEETNEARAAFSKQWDTLMSQLQAAFSPSIGVLNYFTSILTKVNEGIKWFGGYINSIADELGPFFTDLQGMFSELFGGGKDLDSMIKTVKTAFGYLKPVIVYAIEGIGLAAYTIAFIYKKGGEIIVKSIQWLAERVGDIVLFFQSIPDKVSAFVDNLKNTFSNIGTILFDILKQGMTDLWNMVPGFVRGLFGGKEEKAVAPNGSLVNASGKPADTKITVPKDPRPSAIESPSATPATKTTDTPAIDQNNNGMMPAVPVKKQTNGTDTDDHMAQQTELLRQLVDHTNNLVSTNKDILKYTKVS